MRGTDRRLLLIVFFVIPLLANSAQNALTLRVIVGGATADTGQAIASLFSSPDNFLQEPIDKQVLPIDRKGQVRFEFKNLDAGTYAVSIVYDEDSDGKLKTGLFGIPSEPVGMSNNVKGLFGPPSFEDAAFDLQTSDTISITLGPAKD